MIEVASGISVDNQSGLPDAQVVVGLDRTIREVATWADSVRAAAQRPSMFDRSAYAAPDNPYRQMEMAKQALINDDVVSGVADVTEGLAFQGIKWESGEADEADIFNQLSADINLDEFVRTWHREDYTYSQVYVGLWWGTKTYKVRGFNVGEEGKKIRRKREFRSIEVPTAITCLNPLKVVPLGGDIFGRPRLAWHASRAEALTIESPEAAFDSVMANFIGSKLTLPKALKDELRGMGIDPNRLYELQNVFPITRTKAPYEMFSDIRLKSLFGLLDMKQQLMEADRVALVGAANYILLIKKGTKDDPATQPEVDNLKDNFKVIAKLPVIISDHRLEVEIITPAQDYVLQADKYDTLDRRLINRAFGALTVSSSGQRNESTLTVARGIARLLENRRHMLKRSLERNIAREIVERNPDQFKEEPNLAFIPRNVQLDADSQIVQAVMALRTQKELSRETILEYFGFDQSVEAQRREFEEESGLDDIFETVVPFSATDGTSSQVSGARGGRPAGGGDTPQSPQRQTRPRTGSGNPSTAEDD